MEPRVQRGKAKAFEGGRVWWKRGPHSEGAAAMGENCQERAVQSVLRAPLPNLFVSEPDTYAVWVPNIAVVMPRQVN